MARERGPAALLSQSVRVLSRCGCAVCVLSESLCHVYTVPQRERQVFSDDSGSPMALCVRLILFYPLLAVKKPVLHIKLFPWISVL